MCDHCGKSQRAHCARCGVCNPRDVEHPDWCPIQQRRDRQR